MRVKPQVVLDTNVLVAGLRSTSGSSFALLSLLPYGVYDVHLSNTVLLQYVDVLARQQPKLRLPPEQVAAFLVTLTGFAIPHAIFFRWEDAIPDPRDTAFLDLAVTAKADFIVTYNLKHFRGCGKFGIRALEPIELLRRLGDR